MPSVAGVQSASGATTSRPRAELARPWWYPVYYLLSTFALLGYWLRSYSSPKARDVFRLRCAIASDQSERPLSQIWLHGASLGELQGLSPLIDVLSQRYGAESLTVTTTSLTGQKRLAELFPQIRRSLLPFDHPRIVRKWLREYRPNYLIVAETELWPALFVEASHAGVAVFLINGRISDRAFPRYRWLRFLISDLLQRLRWMGVASNTDRERFLALGMSEGALEVTGSTKFDREFPILGEEEKSQLLRETGFDAAQRIIVAGSIRPLEDKKVVDAFCALRRSAPNVALVLAPRHPDKSEHLDGLLADAGLNFRRRSGSKTSASGDNHSLLGEAPKIDVFILDTLGELLNFYQLANIVFVGGTLVPVGGHNPFEAIAYRRPVVVGPWTQNVKDAVAMLRAAEAIEEVESVEDLEQRLKMLLSDADFAAKLVVRASLVFEAQRGSLSRVLSRLMPEFG